MIFCRRFSYTDYNEEPYNSICSILPERLDKIIPATGRPVSWLEFDVLNTDYDVHYFYFRSVGKINQYPYISSGSLPRTSKNESVQFTRLEGVVGTVKKWRRIHQLCGCQSKTTPRGALPGGRRKQVGTNQLSSALAGRSG